MRFLLVTQSASVSPDQLTALAAAARFAVEKFCLPWDISVPYIEALSSPLDAPAPGTIVCDLKDADQGDGTLAFHFESNGLPAIEVDVTAILKYGGGILDDAGTGLSVLAALLHEIYETLVDRWASAYVQRADGSFVALEVGDPAETISIYYDVPDVGRVHTPDAVLPAWFYDDSGDGPYDLAGTMQAPFENDGYMITIPPATASPTGVSQGAAIEVNQRKYTPNLWIYRKDRIEHGKGRGVYRLK